MDLVVDANVPSPCNFFFRTIIFIYHLGVLFSMGKSTSKKRYLLWIAGGTILYYILVRFYESSLSSSKFFAVTLGWLFTLPTSLSVVQKLVRFLTDFLLLIADPLAYVIIGGILGLLVRFLVLKLRH